MRGITCFNSVYMDVGAFVYDYSMIPFLFRVYKGSTNVFSFDGDWIFKCTQDVFHYQFLVVFTIE